MISNLKEFQKVELNVSERLKDIVGEPKEFPKYVTQILDLANQNAQGTRPKTVGKMTELIKQCPQKNFKMWKEWYLKNQPYAIIKATQKVKGMVDNIDKAIKLIDDKMITDWIEDLIIIKTAEGLIIQEIILKYISKKKGEEWRSATSDEESKNIDGYIGNIPISIKPVSYLHEKPIIRDDFNKNIKMIYYDYNKKNKSLVIYAKDDLVKLTTSIEEFWK